MQHTLHTHIRSVVEIDMYGLQSVVCGWLPVLCEGAGKHCCLSIVWIFCMGCVQTDQSTTVCGDTAEAGRLFDSVSPCKHVTQLVGEGFPNAEPRIPYED